MSFGLSLCKFVFGIFNFVIFVCGSTVLGIGIWIVVDTKSILKILQSAQDTPSSPAVLKDFTSSAFLQQASYILITAGVIIFLIGFLGCCGAYQESKCMLTTYAVLLSLFLLLEISAVIFAAVSRKNFDKYVKIALKQSIKIYGANDTDAVTVAWDNVFEKFECCGVENYTDIESSEWWKQTPRYPESCCEKKDRKPEDPFCDKPIELGCYKSFENFISQHEKVIIGIGLGVAAIQLIAIIVACCLCKSITG